MSTRKAVPNDLADKFFQGASVFFEEKPKNAPVPTAESPAIAPSSPLVNIQNDQEAREEISHLPRELPEKERSAEVNKYTSKLVNDPRDPAVNKVGYYFTRKEMDQLDALATKLKPILRDRFNVKMTKNEIIRACLAIGLADWEENGLTSKLVHLLTSK